VRFITGLDYTFPASTLAPGATLVVPRRAAAFALRHPGVPVAPEYFQGDGSNSLNNNGEDLALIAAGGADIVRFSYGDSLPWPTTPDGSGPSLVLIAPMLNPDPADPLHWRASASIDGNPNASDATSSPANPGGDQNGNGLSNGLEYWLGGGPLPFTSSTLVNGVSYLAYTFERDPYADATSDIQTSPDLSNWTLAGTTLIPIARTTVAGGRERVTVRAATPLSGSPKQFLRMRVRTQP